MIRRTSRYAGRERRLAKPAPLVVALALLGFSAIVYATLCPIGLRPRLASPDIERFGAYFIFGLIVSLAAPRRAVLGPALVVFVAFGLEAAQLLIPGRDGVFSDACVKATGGVLGAQLRFASYALRRWVQRSLSGASPILIKEHPTRI